MKKFLKILSFVLLLVSVLTITACGNKKVEEQTAPKEEKRKELTFAGKDATITFKVKQDTDYKLSVTQTDLKTTREIAILLGDTFKIGIEVSNAISYSKYEGSFEAYKESFKDKEEFKEVTYNGLNGFIQYYSGYTRYEVYLPIPNSKQYLLKLNIYSNEDTKEKAKEELDSEKVQDILNNIEVTLKQ